MRIINAEYQDSIFVVLIEVNGFYGYFKGDDTLIEALIEAGFKDDRQ